MNKLPNNSGFTFIELIVGVSLFLSMVGLGFINFSTLPSRTTLNSTYELLYSDIRQQQSLAISENVSRGVHLESDHYILFVGDVYNSSDTSNFRVNFENSNLEFVDISFSGSNIIFNKKDGEIKNFDPDNNSFILRDNLSQAEKLMKLNKYGIEI